MSDGPASDGSPDPLRSVHTTSFPELLRQLGASVLVTTYQAGKLVVLREDAGVLGPLCEVMAERYLREAGDCQSDKREPHRRESTRLRQTRAWGRR